MAYDRFPLPKDLVLKLGDIYPDGWCGPKFEIRSAPAPDARCLKISLLNPDFSPVFLDNDLTVRFDDETNRISGIQLDQQVDLFLSIDANEEFRVVVAIGKAAAPSAFDTRQRSMKLLSIAWVEGRPER
jgi:hypothetical protein